MTKSALTHPDSVEPIMDEVKKHDIRYIRLIIVDLNGMPRALLIPEYELPKALKEGIGIDGSSLGLVNIEHSDLAAPPRPEHLPHPHVGDPRRRRDVHLPEQPRRHPLRRVTAEADSRSTLDEIEAKGMGLNTGPELEYFYVSRSNGSIAPYGSGGYFYLPPMDPTEDMKLETMMNLEAAGFQLEKIHHEVAMGQQEINFRYADALKTADNATLYKLVVKTIAEKHGASATFMPKPFWGMNGSGMPRTTRASST